MKFYLHCVLALMSSTISFIASAQSSSTPVYLPTVYESVMKMHPEGKLGQVIKKESISTTIAGARAWRIAYISSDLAGRKTISTGLIVAPVGRAPKDGRPVIAWAHGTTGTAQNCGPSQLPNPAQPLSEYFLIGGNAGTDYGLPAVEKFIQDGYIVVATDYQGQGGGGKHQYMVSGTQARDRLPRSCACGLFLYRSARRRHLHERDAGGMARLRSRAGRSRRRRRRGRSRSRGRRRRGRRWRRTTRPRSARWSSRLCDVFFCFVFLGAAVVGVVVAAAGSLVTHTL